MNQIHGPVTHPLALGQRVVALRPSCPCKNATYTQVEGVVLKVIHNSTGYWYFLDAGVTVQGQWIQSAE